MTQKPNAKRVLPVKTKHKRARHVKSELHCRGGATPVENNKMHIFHFHISVLQRVYCLVYSRTPLFIWWVSFLHQHDAGPEQVPHYETEKVDWARRSDQSGVHVRMDVQFLIRRSLSLFARRALSMFCFVNNGSYYISISLSLNAAAHWRVHSLFVIENGWWGPHDASSIVCTIKISLLIWCKLLQLH